MSALPQQQPGFPDTWEALCADPRFRDLPYKIELLPQGRILMTPHCFNHAAWQKKISKLLDTLLPAGETLTEVPIRTTAGVRVADVVWMEPSHYRHSLGQSNLTLAPALCIEVASPGNSQQALAEKAALYFEIGAKEVWICNEGHLQFLNHDGRIERSHLVPDFPVHLTLP